MKNVFYCPLFAFLIDLGLIPASILNFSWHPEVADEIKQQLGSNTIYLKDDIASQAKSD